MRHAEFANAHANKQLCCCRVAGKFAAHCHRYISMLGGFNSHVQKAENSWMKCVENCCYACVHTVCSESVLRQVIRTNAEKMIHQLKNDLSTNNLEDIIFGLKLKGIPSQQLKLISSQYHHIPFIQSLVNELINHYNDENILIFCLIF